MSDGFLTAGLRYYGISPWEIEVIYGIFNERFRVTQFETQETDPNFVSLVTLSIPLEFNEEFFKWFEYRRWDKVKQIFKEMKRRRGSSNALKIEIIFSGNPQIGFVLDVEDRSWFDNALEKMDFVIELLPFHLDSSNMPQEISNVIYNFDVETRKWKLNTLFANKKKFILKNDVWKISI
ncbi:hypothetical protein [Candidatus Nitrosotenuis sp. DW1]|uniref:hypothetical protein n=1 Tax=Candidatus Nitrosotenuis sp. DW1 TaxID=2259672 RepID=UPI0015CA7EC8|nr:hypothetical protein [Candidatus Nitrosotenuis sp. DW1]QLH08445.1 hypothetical protein DSQ19_02180 [Candidatus Nitrosotenuis sp. DW1]